MKNTFFGIGFLIVAATAYTQMPIEWRRHKDIERGNTLIQNVENYRQQHQRLPENHDEATLQQLGFRKNKQGWQPNYQKISDTDFMIIYKDGFMPPYLQYSTGADKAEWLLAQ
ncbi:MAG: hypothetical protein Q4B82_02440 [Alysiella sp.]|uniref:hypothetical protein n=1 Tax=Alysiella sp. TaxID=1872483 RepID=UPI0026DCE4BC|nr:hypothetical protein [Alysiella sp.]MDO4433424.1 hypothetical protein [Alysiella sp.]